MSDTAFDGTPVAPAGGQEQGGQQDQGSTTGGWGGSPTQETNSTGRAQEGTLQTGGGLPHPDQRHTQRQAPEGATEYWARQYQAQAREGESLSDFQDRFGQELSARFGRTNVEVRQTKAELQALRQQNEHLASQLAPLIERIHRQDAWDRTQQAMAEIPEDPLERNTYMLEQNLLLQQQQQQDAAEQEQARLAWEAGQQQLDQLDSTWSTELQQAAQDPEFLRDYGAMTRLDLHTVVRSYGPEAEDPFVDPMTGRETGETKAQALVRMAQRNMMRELVARGGSVRQAVADFGREARVAYGVQAGGGNGGNGNGYRPPTGNGAGNNTGQRLAQESDRNQLARTLAVPAGARGGNSGAGEGFDPTTASPEQVQDAIKHGFDYHTWLKQKYGQPDPWGGSDGWNR